MIDEFLWNQFSLNSLLDIKLWMFSRYLDLSMNIKESLSGDVDDKVSKQILAKTMKLDKMLQENSQKRPCGFGEHRAHCLAPRHAQSTPAE